MVVRFLVGVEVGGAWRKMYIIILYYQQDIIRHTCIIKITLSTVITSMYNVMTLYNNYACTYANVYIQYLAAVLNLLNQQSTVNAESSISTRGCMHPISHRY